MKKILMVVLVLSLAAALAACGSKNGGALGGNSAAAGSAGSATSSTGQSATGSSFDSGVTLDADSELVGMPNPFIDCDSIKDAAELAGFTFAAPESIDNQKIQTIQAIKGELIQIFYGSGDDQILVRKAAGKTDTSGDYREYGDMGTVEIGEAAVTLKGSDGKISLAIWTKGDYSYSIGFDTAVDGAALNDVVPKIG